MSMRLAGARARAAAVVTVLLGTLGGGLIAGTAAHADTAGGVSIDVGGPGDVHGSGGRADTMPAGAPSFPNWGPTVPDPLPAAVWSTSRVGESRYVIPGLTAGATYQARLYFLDWYFTHAGQREFDVAIDGVKVLTNFDIIGAAVNAGADGQEAFGVEKKFLVTVGATGTVTFDFTRDAVDQPQVNAIVLVPST